MDVVVDVYLSMAETEGERERERRREKGRLFDVYFIHSFSLSNHMSIKYLPFKRQ